MRILAISDVHGDLGNIEKLRTIEQNVYDAIIVAGDITVGGKLGDEIARQIMSVLSSFGCPVLFVLGNWDNDIPYNVNWGVNCIHIHHTAVEIDGVRFVGMSGVVQNWGQHPHALEILARIEEKSRSKHLKDVKRRCLKKIPAWQGLTDSESRDADREILSCNLRNLIETIRLGDHSRTIVVTHDRLFRMHESVPGVPLYVFGHKHQFSDTHWKGSRYLNVSQFVTNYGDGGYEPGGGTYHDILVKEDMNLVVKSYSLLDVGSAELQWEDWPQRRS